jgi:hypothetical protein
MLKKQNKKTKNSWDIFCSPFLSFLDFNFRNLFPHSRNKSKIRFFYYYFVLSVCINVWALITEEEEEEEKEQRGNE